MRNTLIARRALPPLRPGVSSYEHTSTLGPSSTGVAALIGTWASSNVDPVRELVLGLQVERDRADRQRPPAARSARRAPATSRSRARRRAR